MMSRFSRIAGRLIALALAVSTCTPATSAPTEPRATRAAPTQPTPTATTTAPANPMMILATTTSTQDSGLLDLLVPMFQETSGYTVQTVAVGTGQALKMGEEGNADVLLVHAPSSEKKFMDGGFGTDRALVMHNDFVLVGPATDPAEAGGLPILQALATISQTGSSFVSRGDNSGTHKAESALWARAELNPSAEKSSWYLETGDGMGRTLTVASELGGYTLTDRATFLASRANLQIEILVEGDASLLNVYHVITVNPDKWPKINYVGALAFLNFLIDPVTQAAIGEFGVEQFGEPLFVPDADKSDAALGL